MGQRRGNGRDGGAATGVMACDGGAATGVMACDGGAATGVMASAAAGRMARGKRVMAWNGAAAVRSLRGRERARLVG